MLLEVDASKPTSRSRCHSKVLDDGRMQIVSMLCVSESDLNLSIFSGSLFKSLDWYCLGLAPMNIMSKICSVITFLLDFLGLRLRLEIDSSTQTILFLFLVFIPCRICPWRSLTILMDSQSMSVSILVSSLISSGMWNILNRSSWYCRRLEAKIDNRHVKICSMIHFFYILNRMNHLIELSQEEPVRVGCIVPDIYCTIPQLETRDWSRHCTLTEAQQRETVLMAKCSSAPILSNCVFWSLLSSHQDCPGSILGLASLECCWLRLVEWSQGQWGLRRGGRRDKEGWCQGCRWDGRVR